MSYIVTGHNRTGTNMMFRVLVAGGVPTVATKQSCGFGSAAYKPNPHGLFEYQDETFLCGHVLKHNRLFDETRGIPGTSKVVVMRRDVTEILISHGKSWGALHGVTEEKIKIHYEKLIDYLERNSVEYIDVEYSSVIENTYMELMRVRDFGIPISVKDAASVVDTDLYRCKIV